MAIGWARAHKHTKKPDEAFVKETIEAGVLNALCDVIRFDDKEVV